MDGTIQPLPGDRIPPEPKRRESARKKKDEHAKPFELEPAPRQELETPNDAVERPKAAHDDGVGSRIDVTA